MPEFCVTGGTGLIGSNLVKALLREGHTVRATVRDPEDESKVGFLWSMEGAKDRLKLVKADLTVPGSFDDAVAGADGVFHAASPVLVPYDDRVQETLIDPTVKGTMNVLSSCSKQAAANPPRVVLTSSCSCIRYADDATAASPLGESRWSDLDYCIRNKLWYAYAKTMAEKQAWSYAEEHGVDLVAVNPSFVVGPLITPSPTSSIRLIFSLLKGEMPEYPNTTIGFVHIDDVVRAHLLAMSDRRIAGRLVCSGEVANMSEVVGMLREKHPRYPITDRRSGAQSGDDNPHAMDATKLMALGVPPMKTIPAMLDDCVRSFQDKGLLL